MILVEEENIDPDCPEWAHLYIRFSGTMLTEI